MPRHRKERVPSHRALRRADNPARRAGLTPAADTPVTALFDPTGGDPDAADTVPLRWSARTIAPGPGERHRRAGARANGDAASSKTGVLRAAARGLLVTPWFAAASGFVIAASLWIYVPHAHLSFPGYSAIQSQHCDNGCAPAARGKDSGRLATSGRGQLREPRTTRSRAGGTHPAVRTNRPAVTGLTFSYYPMPSQRGRFYLMIRVVGQRAIKGWRLSFALPGDVIRKVSNADWQRTSRDSGTASGDGQLPQWPGKGQGSGGQGGGGQFGGGQHQYVLTFFVSGKGSPVGPTNCVYNGQTCVFTNGRPGPS
jgi:hypothetical protein